MRQPKKDHRERLYTKDIRIPYRQGSTSDDTRPIFDVILLGRNESGRYLFADTVQITTSSHIHPIVRGKVKSSIEVGAKIGASIVQGYTFVDHHCWGAYNESLDLILQVELYRQRFGFLPARIYADKIYMNKANRKLMKKMEIEAMEKPLGMPP